MNRKFSVQGSTLDCETSEDAYLRCVRNVRGNNT